MARVGIVKTFSRQAERHALLAAAQTPAGTLGGASEVVLSLARWFAINRRVFPWRLTTNAYRVLIAEVLLRKTTAPVVARFLPEFLARYSNPAKLATATLDDLANHLAPIGLSEQRGRQLQALGQVLVQRHAGAVPQTAEELLDLPGVGVYTAALVAAGCFGEQLPAVDTNVARVICRVFDITPARLEARKSPNVWQAAGELLSFWPEHPAEFSWALLDLGALICTVRRPHCATCPLLQSCAYAKHSHTLQHP